MKCHEIMPIRCHKTCTGHFLSVSKLCNSARANVGEANTIATVFLMKPLRRFHHFLILS